MWYPTAATTMLEETCVFHFGIQLRLHWRHWQSQHLCTFRNNKTSPGAHTYFFSSVSVHVEGCAHLKSTLVSFSGKNSSFPLAVAIIAAYFFLHPLKMRSSSPDVVINSKLQQLLMATPIKTAGINLVAIYSISEVSSFTSPVSHPMVTEACHSGLQITLIGQRIESRLL